MSSSVFKVDDINLDKEPNFCAIIPIDANHLHNAAAGSVLLDETDLPSLPGLDEFCRNSIDQVNEICNLLGHNGEAVFDINQLPNTSLDVNLGHQPIEENTGFRSLNFDAPLEGPTVDCAEKIRGCDEGTVEPAVTLLDISTGGSVLIGQLIGLIDQLMATAITNFNEEFATNERNPFGTDTTLPLTSDAQQVEEPNEDESDEAIQNLSHCSIDMSVVSGMARSRKDSIATPKSYSGIDLTPEINYEVDRFVREVSDADLLAEAAKGFENLDNASDLWDNSADETLSDNEYVVGKILDRRLLNKVKDGNPQEGDYEYLVSWEGYSEEDNTWEPYEHLKHCPQKLVEYSERLKQKALRSRGGKRI